VGKLIPGNDSDPRPHGLMAEAAILVTRHQVVARSREPSANLGDETGTTIVLIFGDRVDKCREHSIQQNQYQPIEVAQPYPRWRLAG